MKYLTTYVTQKGPNKAIIFWQRDEELGCTQLTLDKSYPDFALVAELIMLRQLATECTVREPAKTPAKAMHINVTHPLIAGIVSGDAEAPAYASRYAAFLSQRFLGAHVTPIRGEWPNFFDTWPTRIEERHLTAAECLNTFEQVEHDLMGKVEITRHALERCHERFGVKAELVWGKLIKQLKSGGFQQLVMPKEVQEHKRYKYRNGTTPELWGNPDTTYRFLALNRGPKKPRLVVTVFQAPEVAI